MSEKIKSKPSNKELLNSVKPEKVRDAVYALHQANIEPTERAVASHIASQMQAGRQFERRMYNRLAYEWKNPEIVAQQNAFTQAVEEIQASTKVSDTSSAASSPLYVAPKVSPINLDTEEDIMNSVTPIMIKSAVYALHRLGNQLSAQDVSEYLASRMKNGVLDRTLMSARLTEPSDNPLAEAQRNAFRQALDVLRKNTTANDVTKSSTPNNADLSTPPSQKNLGVHVPSSKKPADTPRENASLKATQGEEEPAQPSAVIEPPTPVAMSQDRTQWTNEGKPEQRLERLVTNIDILARRIEQFKQREWVQKFAPSAYDTVSSTLQVQRKKLLDLRGMLERDDWYESQEAQYRHARRNLIEMEIELKTIDGH